MVMKYQSPGHTAAQAAGRHQSPHRHPQNAKHASRSDRCAQRFGDGRREGVHLSGGCFCQPYEELVEACHRAEGVNKMTILGKKKKKRHFFQFVHLGYNLKDSGDDDKYKFYT